jgi:hypothetical protein
MRRVPALVPAFVIALGVWVSIDAAARAQDADGGQPARPVTESAERIANELWPIDERGLMDERNRPPFRASVTEFTLPLPWQETDPTWTRLQPAGRLYHREFLSVVTPEAFRAGAMTAAVGAGVSTDPGAVLAGIRRAWRDWQARRIHERVEQELAELRARLADEPAP